MNGIIFCQRYTKSCFIARPLFDLKLVSSYRHFVLRYLKFYKDLIQNFCVQFNTILIPLKYVFLQGQGEVNIQGIIVFVGKHISIGRGRLTAKLYICVQVCVCVWYLIFIPHLYLQVTQWGIVLFWLLINKNSFKW